MYSALVIDVHDRSNVEQYLLIVIAYWFFGLCVRAFAQQGDHGHH